jgi:hypothetical protein
VPGVYFTDISPFTQFFFPALPFFVLLKVLQYQKDYKFFNGFPVVFSSEVVLMLQFFVAVEKFPMKFNFVEKFSGNFKLGSRHGYKFSLISQAWAKPSYWFKLMHGLVHGLVS